MATIRIPGLEALLASAARMQSVQESAKHLIDNIPVMLREAAAQDAADNDIDPADLQAVHNLADQIAASADGLAASVVANTPAAAGSAPGEAGKGVPGTTDGASFPDANRPQDTIDPEDAKKVSDASVGLSTGADALQGSIDKAKPPGGVSTKADPATGVDTGVPVEPSPPKETTTDLPAGMNPQPAAASPDSPAKAAAAVGDGPAPEQPGDASKPVDGDKLFP